jgi:2-keto-4-pentenoate hydratase/2-oxohepta-3-ene-1,7-dioic acid hydratase in catechol pathway
MGVSVRIASYEIGGRPSFGIVKDGGVVDVAMRAPSMPGLLDALRSEGGMGQIRRFAGEQPDADLAAITFLPVVPRPEKVICVGLNYRDHAAEIGAEIPGRPTLFVRFPDAQVGHLQPLMRPKVSHRFDYEGELAVIIGASARHVGRDKALECVAGYCCFNDGTIRDWQGHSSQFTAGKNFVRSGAIGPWLTTADEIAEPGRLALKTRVNDALVQDGSTSDMVFDVPALIEYVTAFTELRPGDVIATGTPAGVGYRREPRLYMKAGDTVEIEIEGIGTLRNSVVDEA